MGPLVAAVCGETGGATDFALSCHATERRDVISILQVPEKLFDFSKLGEEFLFGLELRRVYAASATA